MAATSSRSAWGVVAVWLGVVALAAPTSAQSTGGGAPVVVTRPDTTDPMSRALAAEDRNDVQAAATAYRDVLARAMRATPPDGDRIAFALLGLERNMVDMGALDSLVPLVQRVLLARPTDPIAHSIELRSLVTLGRVDEAQTAFVAWRRASGSDATPYREYARLLMQQGRSLAADSLLNEAGRLMGSSGALAGEAAQLHVSLQRWNAAAVAYRAAFVQQPWLETAALFGLARAPVAARDSIRQVMAAAPVVLVPRRLLSQLEFAWNDPRRAWLAIAAVPVDDSTAQAWREFGERAELGESWLVARDAWTAVFERRPDAEAQRHAADDALRAGDAAGALAMVRRAVPASDAPQLVHGRLAIEIAALGELGRIDEAQQLLNRQSATLDAASRAALSRPLVIALLRSGDLTKARVLIGDTELVDDDEMAGWMALYDGDLAMARKRLVRAATQRRELVEALGVLARVRLDVQPGLGQAFQLLARRDTARAAARFAALADSVGTAAPSLLALSARLLPARSAAATWDRIVRSYPKSPEAPEALLAWARQLRDAGDKPAAVSKLEQLLVEYPESALGPQARRDLERLKGQVPPSMATPAIR